MRGNWTTVKLRVCHMIAGDQWAGAEVQTAHLLSGLARRKDLELSAVLFSEGLLAKDLRRSGVSVAVLDEGKLGRFGLLRGNRWPIVIGQTGCVVFLVIGAYSGDPIIAAAFLGLCFFFQQITEGAYWASSIAIGNQFAGAAGGVLNTGANVMGILNSLFVPIIALTFNWSVAIASGAIFTSLALVLVMFARADQPIDLD